MTDNELRKLGRKELLEIMLKQSTEIEELNTKLQAAEAALNDRQIKIDNAGSIAAASLQLNGVFEAAEAACRQYIENIENLNTRQQEVCAKMEEESRNKAFAIIDAAQKQQAALELKTKTQCDEMIAKAKAESQAYWDEVSGKLQAFVSEHEALTRLFSIMQSAPAPTTQSAPTEAAESAESTKESAE